MTQMASLMKRLLSDDAHSLAAAASTLTSHGHHVHALQLARRAVTIMPLAFAPRYELAQIFQRWYRHSPACAHIRVILQQQQHQQHQQLSQRDVFALLSVHQHSALLSCTFSEASWSVTRLIEMVRNSIQESNSSRSGDSDYLQYVNVWEAEFPDDVIAHMTAIHARRITAAAVERDELQGADTVVNLSACSASDLRPPSCDQPSILFIYSPGFTGDMPTTRLLQALPRLLSRFTPICVSIGMPDSSPEVAEWRRGCSVWEVIDGRTSDADISRKLRRYKAAVAVDLAGFAQSARPGVFAMRVAPLQVCFHGFLVSMGGLFTDYFTSDVSTSPPDVHAAVSEKIILLPHTLFITSFAFSRSQNLQHVHCFIRIPLISPPPGLALMRWQTPLPSSSKVPA
jgi:predicted O-linked N-acetylglucosamine transferase (SPINDLY family)